MVYTIACYVFVWYKNWNLTFHRSNNIIHDDNTKCKPFTCMIQTKLICFLNGTIRHVFWFRIRLYFSIHMIEYAYIPVLHLYKREESSADDTKKNEKTFKQFKHMANKHLNHLDWSIIKTVSFLSLNIWLKNI